MKKHVNIPVFIPHLGCPNQCVFCNQRFISGVNNFDISRVKTTIETALSTVTSDIECEIAFFGGSFTGIDRELMIELLEISRSYLISGRVSSVRCSTRPDYISEEILEILKKYGVTTIELGFQSSSDQVLRECKRGHGFHHEDKACELIKTYGFSLIGQMMIGLPGSTPEDEIATAEFICSKNADGARIYPTVVFKDTELSSMVDAGIYRPLTEEEAIERSSGVYKIFSRSGIPVIRIGLCESESLSSDRTYKAGPNSPSLGEKIISRVYLDALTGYLSKKNVKNDKIIILVAKGCTSKVVGHKRTNITYIKERFGFKEIKVREDNSLSGLDFQVL